MPQKPLHIISFDNPYPPVYGGAIDVFYKIKALHAAGYNIFLHCFVDDELSEYEYLRQFVFELYIYKRKYKSLKWFSMTPLPVLSRFHKDLLSNIEKNAGPLLFEGLQTTYILNKHQFTDRKIYLRLHNLEADYFSGLSKSETSFIKKILYRLESAKYGTYQKIMSRFDRVFTLSKYETEFVNAHFRNAVYVPVFHGNEEVAQLSEFGKYAFYHGDLRMSDNKKAALFLINVFKQIPDYSLVIASNKGRKLIENQIKEIPNITFSSIKNEAHLDEMLANSHISVMLSFQQSGTKLKAVNSLYKSRFCIINKNMIDDENISALCTVAETEAGFIEAVNDLKTQPYKDNVRRSSVLRNVLNDGLNALKIKQVLEAERLKGERPKV